MATTPYTVLIVDDSATTRAMIKRTIQLAALPVERLYEAGNGREALDLMDCLKVDLVLADLNMPDMNGFEMTRRMSASTALRGIPVVVVSAEPNAQDFAHGCASVRGVLRKPFTPEGIRTMVNQVMGGNHA